MADLPLDLDADLGELLARALDREGRIPRALEALGPVAGRDVLLLDAADGLRAGQLRELGARVTMGTSAGPGAFDAPDDSADVIVSCWSAFRGAPDDEVAQAERILRPGGRLLVLHDYGRDDLATLRGDPPEPHAWSKRNGPFLGRGFRIRVIHCFLTFDSLDDAGMFLGSAFGATGQAHHAAMTRARVSYNVAVFHRTFGAGAEEANA